MGDLPMHEALVAIVRHAHDAAWAHGLYFVVAPQANQLFYALASALSFALPTDAACKLVVAAALFLAPVATARWLAGLGASRWASLLVAPIALGWMFKWGLVQNILGFVAFLFAMPAMEALAEGAPAKRAARALVAMVVVFFAHESAALALAIVAAWYAAARATSIRDAALRGAPVSLFGALALAQSIASRVLLGATMRAIGNDYGLTPPARVAILPGAIFGRCDAARLAILAAASIAALAASAGRRDAEAGRLAWRARHAWLAAIFFALFLSFPMSLGGATLLAHRFLPFAWAMLVAACARARMGAARAAIASLLPLVVVAVAWQGFIEADRRYRDLDALLPRIPEGVAIAQLDLSPPGAPGHARAGAAGREPRPRDAGRAHALRDDRHAAVPDLRARGRAMGRADAPALSRAVRVRAVARRRALHVPADAQREPRPARRREARARAGGGARRVGGGVGSLPLNDRHGADRRARRAAPRAAAGDARRSRRARPRDRARR